MTYYNKNILTSDLELVVPGGSSIQDALDTIPENIQAAATVILEGDKDNVTTHTLSSDIVINKNITGENGGLSIETSAIASTYALAAAGGAINYVDIPQVSMPGTLAGEWAGAELSVLSDNAGGGHVGETRIIDGAGAVVNGANWRFTVTVNFTAAITATSIVRLDSCLVKGAGGGFSINIPRTGGGVCRLYGFSFDRNIYCGNISTGTQKYLVSDAVFSPQKICMPLDTLGLPGLMLDGGRLLTDEDEPFYICGATYGLWIRGYALANVDFSGANGDGYISAATSRGIDVSSTSPGGLLYLKSCTLDQNTTAIDIRGGRASIQNNTFIGAGGNLNCWSQNNAAVHDSGNAGIVQQTANGGVFY